MSRGTRRITTAKRAHEAALDRAFTHMSESRDTCNGVTAHSGSMRRSVIAKQRWIGPRPTRSLQSRLLRLKLRLNIYLVCDCVCVCVCVCTRACVRVCEREIERERERERE